MIIVKISSLPSDIAYIAQHHLLLLLYHSPFIITPQHFFPLSFMCVMKCYKKSRWWVVGEIVKGTVTSICICVCIYRWKSVVYQTKSFFFISPIHFLFLFFLFHGFQCFTCELQPSKFFFIFSKCTIFCAIFISRKKQQKHKT